MAKLAKKPVEKQVIPERWMKETPPPVKPVPVVLGGHWQLTHDDPPRLVWVKDD